MYPTVAKILIALQILFALGGIGLLAAWFLAPKLQPWRTTPPRQPLWSASLSDSLILAWVALAAAVVGSLWGGSVAHSLVGKVQAEAAVALLLSGCGFHGGVLLALAAFARYLRARGRPLPPTSAPGVTPVVVFACAFATFAITLPFVFGAGALSTFVLQALGLPVERQDLVGLFASTDSPLLRTGMLVLATTLAPLNEEILFRAGLYRFLRTGLPRWGALLVSATVFASLHFNAASFAPLLLLGIVFALAYEKTGSIFVPVIAHALFNLNTIAVILLVPSV